MLPALHAALRPAWRPCIARRAISVGVSHSTGSVTASVGEIFSLFDRHGCSDYVGESVSQLQHALQAAHLASISGFGDDAILAALLHDCGHMLGLDNASVPRMGACGIMDHENMGGAWLRMRGFSPRVCELVARHVDAKRYLCCVKPEYHAKLSDASLTTLGYQGGPMVPEEAKAFEGDELFRTIIAMRHWDEAAKEPDKAVPQLEAYRPLLERHLRAGEQGNWY